MYKLIRVPTNQAHGDLFHSNSDHQEFEEGWLTFVLALSSALIKEIYEQRNELKGSNNISVIFRGRMRSK